MSDTTATRRDINKSNLLKVTKEIVENHDWPYTGTWNIEKIVFE